MKGLDLFFRKPSLTEKLLKLARHCECAFELCEKADSIFQKPIQILGYNEFLPHVQASVFDVSSCFLIFLKPTLTPLSVQFAIFHEVSHICLEHLVPVTAFDLIENWSGENYFTPLQEEAARKLASELFSALMDVDLLSPPNTPVGARFESLFI